MPKTPPKPTGAVTMTREGWKRHTLLHERLVRGGRTTLCTVGDRDMIKALKNSLPPGATIRENSRSGTMTFTGTRLPKR